MDKSNRDADMSPEETGRWRLEAHLEANVSKKQWYVNGCGYRDRYERDRAALRMVETLYYFKANERARDATFWVAKAIERTLSDRQFDTCREFLRIVAERVDAVPFESLGSILTATFVVKAKLASERSALYEAVSRHYAERLGADKAARILAPLA